MVLGWLQVSVSFKNIWALGLCFIPSQPHGVRETSVGMTKSWAGQTTDNQIHCTVGVQQILTLNMLTATWKAVWLSELRSTYASSRCTLGYVYAPGRKQGPNTTPTVTTKSLDFCSLGCLLVLWGPFWASWWCQKCKAIRHWREQKTWESTVSHLFEGLVFKLDVVWQSVFLVGGVSRFSTIDPAARS